MTRSSRSTALALLALAALLAAPGFGAEGPETLAIGAAAPDFDLPGTDGARYSLADFADDEILVIVFTANHCPTAQAYEDRVLALHAEYAPRGVQIVLVSPNDPLAVRLDEQGWSDLGDTLEDMKIRARDKGFPFPYLYDGETQAMARAYGPKATPHVFVFDETRRLRFVGRIDDGENPAKITTTDTRNAIEALLAGKPVPVETTKVFGCSIKWSDKREWVKKGYEDWAKEPVTLETDRHRRYRGPGRQRLEEAPAGQRVGHLVRPVRDRVPRPRVPPPDLPGPGLRGRHHRRRLPREPRQGPRVPEGAAGVDPELRLRQGRPLRPHRGRRRRVGRATCPTRFSWPREARSSTAATGPST